MCRRLACGLSAQEISESCCYKNSGDNLYVIPQWKDAHNSGKKYTPSYSVCQSEVAAVLLSGSHFKLNSRIVCPMVFGVIPQWKSKAKYNTVNCRIEGVMTSKLYRDLLENGQRCAVICNGFYETDRSKKPYFFFDKQADGIVIDNPKTWNLKFTPENGYSGFKPLKLAALFNKNSDILEEAILSFTIITKEASSETSEIHPRIPAILRTDEQLDAWLNYEEVDAQCALTCISEGGNLLFHPVSSVVNKNIKHDISCIKQEKKSVKSEKDSADFLRAWLKAGQKRKESPVTNEPDEKVKKMED